MAHDIKRKSIIKSLLKKGFIKSGESSDHERYCFYYNGKKYGHIVAKISRGSSYKTYGINLIKLMKGLLKLKTNEQIYDLFECPMDHDQYVRILRDEGELD